MNPTSDPIQRHDHPCFAEHLKPTYSKPLLSIVFRRFDSPSKAEVARSNRAGQAKNNSSGYINDGAVLIHCTFYLEIAFERLWEFNLGKLI